jgi:CRP/FNR family transcriptional regulator, nitrogen oxide reductase regulator
MKTPTRRDTPPIPLFDGLPEVEASRLLAVSAARTFRSGAVLCRQGEPAASMFLVRNGRVKFVRSTANGHDVIIRWLGPGDCFGIGSLVAGPVCYMGTAQATGEGRLYRWDADTIQEAAASSPRLAQNALRIVLRYFKEFGDRHLALLSASAEHRLARTLTRLGATTGRILPTGVEIDITNRDLGSLADVGIYTVSRQLGHWARHGHLVKHRQRILVRHPEALLGA